MEKLSLKCRIVKPKMSDFMKELSRMFPPAGQFGEQLPKLDQRMRHGAARYDDAHGSNNQHDTRHIARRKHLTEYRHTEEDGGGRFERTEDGGRRGTDVLDGSRRAEQGDSRGEQAQRKEVAPEIPLAGKRQALTRRKQPHGKQRQTE